MQPTLEAFSGAVAAIHEAAAAPERWHGALKAVMRLMGATKAALLDVDVATRSPIRLAACGHSAEVQRLYVEHYSSIDPTLELALGMPAHQPMATYEHFSPEVRSRSEYFQFVRRADIGDVLAVNAFGLPGVLTCLSLQAPYDGERHDATAKRMLARLSPHLEVAKRIEQRLADASRCASAVAAGLDRFAVPAFIVDGGARLVHLNEAARVSLSGRGALRLVGGRIAAADPKLASAFDHALRHAVAPAPASSILAARGEAGEAEEIAVSPLTPDHVLAAAWEIPLALVTLARPMRDAESIARRMRLLHGLTAAEAKVVAELALGSSVEEIALAHGVRASTVRAQLKTVFEKTGAGRQAELVRLALAGAPLV